MMVLPAPKVSLNTTVCARALATTERKNTIVTERRLIVLRIAGETNGRVEFIAALRFGLMLGRIA